MLGAVQRTRRAAWHGSVGDFSSAGLGPMFWVDPREQLYAVVMAQTSFAEAGRLNVLMRSLGLSGNHRLIGPTSNDRHWRDCWPLRTIAT